MISVYARSGASGEGTDGSDSQVQEHLARDAAEFNRALLDLMRVYQLRDRGRLGGYDLSTSAAHALENLVRLGPVGLNRLATELFVDKSTASRIVAGLEEKGYVRRVMDPEDRRALRIEVTPQGRDLHERLREDALRESTEVLRTFTTEARQVMIGRIRQVARASATRAGFSEASCCLLAVEGDGPLPPGVELRAAAPADLEEALPMLSAEGLPTEGVADHFPDAYVVAHDLESGALAGLVGVEAYGAEGLLRSLVVGAPYRGAGLGRALALAGTELARVTGTRELYLLTATAPDFFRRLGWEEVRREDLPASLHTSAELRGACSESATAMRLRLP